MCQISRPGIDAVYQGRVRHGVRVVLKGSCGSRGLHRAVPGGCGGDYAGRGAVGNGRNPQQPQYVTTLVRTSSCRDVADTSLCCCCCCIPARLFLAMSPPMFDEAEKDALRVMALCRGAEKVKMGTPKEGVEEAHKFEARSKESAEGSTEEKLSAKAKRKQRKRAKAAKAVDDQRSSVGGIARALLGEVRRQRRQANAGNAGKAAQGGEG